MGVVAVAFLKIFMRSVEYLKHQDSIVQLTHIVMPGDCLYHGCLTSQQHASVSQGRVCSDNCTFCHTEIEVAGQTFHLSHSILTPDNQSQH